MRHLSEGDASRIMRFLTLEDVAGSKEVDPAFFDYISVNDTGRTGLTLHALYKLHTADSDFTWSTADVLRLQTSLFTLWVDKMKVLPEDAVHKCLLGIPQTYWNPDYARPSLEHNMLCLKGEGREGCSSG